MNNKIEKDIQKEVSLAPFSTFKIGGRADFFIDVKNRNELIEATTWAENNKIKFFIIAGGSNILINDNGFRGLIIKYSDNKIQLEENKLKCAAGAILSKIVKQTKDFNLSGIEWASKIPGTIGGATRGNAGAFGGEMKDIVFATEVFDIKNNKIFILNHDECKFDYRDSVFKHNKNLIILSVTINLIVEEKKKINKLIKQYSEHRLKALPKEPSAGCIFKNIKLSELEKNNKELAELARRTIEIWGGEIGAGWFIDKLGLKGKTIGGAKISNKHANFIINANNAKAEDVVMLISLVKQKIRKEFGIQMHEEIQYLGF